MYGLVIWTICFTIPLLHGILQFLNMRLFTLNIYLYSLFSGIQFNCAETLRKVNEKPY